MSPIVTYTLLAICAAMFIAGMWLGDEDRRDRFPRLSNYSLVLMLAGILGAYFTVRPGDGDDGSSAIQQAVAAQKPLFIDIYSNY